jgi:hypothetical protein
VCRTRNEIQRSCAGPRIQAFLNPGAWTCSFRPPAIRSGYLASRLGLRPAGRRVRRRSVAASRPFRAWSGNFQKRPAGNGTPWEAFRVEKSGRRSPATKPWVEAIEPDPGRDVPVWDTDLPGFGVKVTPRAPVPVFTWQSSACRPFLRVPDLGCPLSLCSPIIR